ncbi:MAG: beta-lactamase domain protein [Deltaproteobacteria bacterium]|nr:beta-lactamase domain protein [Deltaproteobacteria bacterium]
MDSVVFDVWGSRGGRSYGGSRIGTLTSCYSIAAQGDLFVFDGGRGLARLAEALFTDVRFSTIKRVHVHITHAHLDHWEGLKDAEWMWRKGNGLALTLLGPKEALDAIRHGYQPPSYVPLEILALGTLGSLSFVELVANSTVEVAGASLQTVALHHYSGMAPNRRYLDAIGYRLALLGGPALVYLNDHEPVAATRELEDSVLAGSHLAIVDANYCNAAEHAFGHGSIESAADVARRHPETLMLASHHGPMFSDTQIEDAHRRHGVGLSNLAIAVEGESWLWDATVRKFTRRA